MLDEHALMTGLDSCPEMCFEWTGQASGTAVLGNKALESRLQKESGAQTHAFPRKNREEEEQKLTLAYTLKFSRDGAILLSHAPPKHEHSP